MLSLIPIWRAFSTIDSDAEAASISTYCFFSLATLEVARSSETASIAVTERERPEVWRWAIVSTGGTILDDGRESTQEAAKTVAAEALQLVRS